MTVLRIRLVAGVLFIGVIVCGTLVGGFVADMADRLAFTLTLVAVFRDLRLV